MVQYLTNAQLRAEVDKCLGCKNKPCMNACPIKCCPQEFIAQAKQNNWDKSVEVIKRDNPMGQTCGLICPDKFCMSACTRKKIDTSINIPKVQATIMQNYNNIYDDKFKNVNANGKQIAIIGAGPAGLSAAYELSNNGFKVVIFESRDRIGGALTLIPNDRLPQEVIEKDWSFLLKRNLVELKLNTYIENFENLLNEGFSGVIIAIGEQNITKLGIEGAAFSISYTEYLSNPQNFINNLNVCIVGGGNVAVDCALTAINLGAENVDMLVRRKLSDMRISKAEFMQLIEKHINVMSLSSPEKIEKHNNLFTIYVHRNHFVDGKLQALPNSIAPLSSYDLVVTAIGSKAMNYNENQYILLAGDCKQGGTTAVEAIASGKDVAFKLMKNLQA